MGQILFVLDLRLGFIFCPELTEESYQYFLRLEISQLSVETVDAVIFVQWQFAFQCLF